MQQEQAQGWSAGRALAYVLAAAGFGLLLASILLPVAPAVVLSVVALALLGAAASWLVLARVAAPVARLGGQAHGRWQRQRMLAAFAAGLVFVALVLGVVATNTGALWACESWPACAVVDDMTMLAMLHRAVAGVGSLVALVVAGVVLASRSGRGTRRLAWALVALVVLQNSIGLVQVLLAAEGASLPTEVSRLAHLSIGALTWAALAALATLVVRVPPMPRPAPATKAEAEPKTPSLFKDYVSLTKPGVISLLIFTTFAAMFITPAGVPNFWTVFWTMIGGWLMPAGAHSLNCYFDRDIDVLMGRTGRRPIPSGRIPAWHALVLGLVLGALAFVILAVFVNVVTALLALAGYIYYAVLYTLILKRSTHQNIVIGGGAGAFPPLIGWAAATGGLSLASIILFMIIFYWTPPHFWALALIRQKDYANAGVPMLPVVAGDDETKRQILLYTLLMVALSLLPTPMGMFGLAYLVAAVLLGAWFLRYVVLLFRNDTTPNRWGLYRFSLLYLFLLFVAMMLDRLAFAWL